VLTWYRAQDVETQAKVSIGIAGAMALIILVAALLDLPWWIPLGVAAIGLTISMILRRERMRP
jgi:hypothetical protein